MRGAFRNDDLEVVQPRAGSKVFQDLGHLDGLGLARVESGEEHADPVMREARVAPLRGCQEPEEEAQELQAQVVCGHGHGQVIGRGEGTQVAHVEAGLAVDQDHVVLVGHRLQHVREAEDPGFASPAWSSHSAPCLGTASRPVPVAINRSMK